MQKFFFLVMVLTLILKPVFAQHDENCSGCHNLHDAKAPFSMAIKPDTTIINPYTKEKISGQSAICMGCHNGSAGPEIDMKKTHPVGMKPNPDKVKVDTTLLTKTGIFECSSCHDFHPSNTKYKYLRVDVKPENLGLFCALCHASKRQKNAPIPSLE
ncbi:MAG: cytochrome c3 family protein [bacterium]|nr:cytochrome c3 family protein [bacterium]